MAWSVIEVKHESDIPPTLEIDDEALKGKQFP